MAIVVALAACDSTPAVKGLEVREANYGERWPLNVPSAILDCDPPSAAYVQVADKRYALNGKALTAGYPRPDEIRKNREVIFMADFAERAMEICMKQKG